MHLMQALAPIPEFLYIPVETKVLHCYFPVLAVDKAIFCELMEMLKVFPPGILSPHLLPKGNKPGCHFQGLNT